MSAGFEAILKDIKNKKLAAIYYLCGEEEFFIDKLVNAFEENVLTEAEKSFNMTVLYGKDAAVQQIIEASRRLPMMAERQLVIIKEAQALSLKEDQEEKLVSYITHPVKSTVLVFAHKYGMPDKRKKFAKELQKSAVFFESKKLYENQISDWARERINERKLNIKEDALRLLTEFVGNDLTTLNNQIEKIAIGKADGHAITALDIENNVGISKEYSVFELQNALGYKDKSKAYKIVNYFCSNPKNAPFVLVLSNLYAYFSKIYMTVVNKDLPDRELAVLLKVNPYFIRDYKQPALHYSKEKVEAILIDLAEYDKRSKGINNHNTADGELLKELIYKIIN